MGSIIKMNESKESEIQSSTSSSLKNAPMKLPLQPITCLALVALQSLSTNGFADTSVHKTKLQLDADTFHVEYQQPSEGISLGEIRLHDRVYAAAGNMKDGGPLVDENTLFEIGSISKVFTGILLADTVLQGKAQLEDSIGKHLPEGVLSDDSPLHAVTLLELSTHTSGLPRAPANLYIGANSRVQGPFAHYSREDMFKYLNAFKEEDFEQRGSYAYSNMGVGLLGEILAIIHETDYPALLKTRILSPLKMNSTWVQQHTHSVPESLKYLFATGHKGGEETPHWPLNAFSGACGIVSSVSDLLTLAEAHWSENTPEYLREAFELAMKTHSEKVGLGWILRGSAFSHGGITGGFITKLRIQPDEHYAIVSLRNSAGEKVVVMQNGEFSELIGFWSGTLEDGVEKRHFVIHVTEKGDANMYSINKGGRFIPNAKASYDSDTKQLAISYPMIKAHYTATLEDGKLKGNWSQGKDLELEMEHSAQMPNPLAKEFDRIYSGDLKSLVGYWSGQIIANGGKAFVYLEITPVVKDGDRHEARIWTPGLTSLPMGVSKFSYDPTGDHELLIESTETKGTFKGSVDSDAKTLSGIWAQENDVAFLLKWSAERPEEGRDFHNDSR